ncbi:MAG TPA: D-Ala-D-Ala carboxypeptidase family metallohydrolase [Reyranellaceae bacterium]|nr:D-Ala-D-Ala carboxypeptidase family metallohydrolase [Reyranellaceae bacterium]
MSGDLTIARLDGPEILFRHAELADRDTREGRLAPGFARALAELRMSFGRPMQVNSCCRTLRRNNLVGGHPRSLHIYDASPHGIAGTCAIDIATPDIRYALDLARLAIATGWSVGVNKRFLHLDRRADHGLPPGLFGY